MQIAKDEWENLRATWLGLADYEETLKRQLEAVERVRAGGVPEVLFCEHPAVITLGKRGQPLDILTSMETLRREKIGIVATDRGGQATLHNPGQLVIYPILPLKNWGLSVRDYVECLERATAHFLAEFGMDVVRGYEPGLFVEGRKIAAFGIRVDRGVSLHGAAINIKNDLEPFKLIKQCGLTSNPTNLEKEMKAFTPNVPEWNFEELADQWLTLFKDEVRACLNPVSETAGTPEKKSELVVDVH